MIAVLLLSAFFGSCLGSPIAAVWLSPIAPVAPLTQYHAQDGTGGYHYAYSGPHHAKTETSLNGVTQGGYSYIDANGILQTVSYSADAENGFRVRASNLPQQPKDDLRPVEDTPEVASARRDHLEELRKAELRAGQEADAWQIQKNVPYILPYRVPQPESHFGFSNTLSSDEEDDHQDEDRSEKSQYSRNPFLLPQIEADRIKIPKPNSKLDAPLPISNQSFQKDAQKLQFNPVPVQKFAPLPSSGHYILPVVPYRLLHSSLHHTQDSLGQYDYTYTGDSSAKTESRSLDGTTRGAYSYVDANGLLQQVHYIADHNGFRVAATNLPEAK